MKDIKNARSPFIAWMGALSIAIGVLPLPAKATTVAMPFGDHMVLQRNFPVPVWGMAEPGEKITVKVNQQTKTTNADRVGKWQVKLDPMPAGGSFTLIVQGKDTLTIQDVMVGEVWVAGGQSNMARTLGGGDDANAANLPKLRYLTTHPVNGKSEGQWTVVSPATAGGMSITAFYFARELQTKLNVPVGVIIGAQGSTFIQRWVDPKGEPVEGMAKGGDLFNAYLGSVIPYGVKGAIWYQGEADSKEGYNSVYHLRLPALIRYWRRVWQQPDLPFYIVQLSTTGPLQTAVEQGDGGGWPVVREAQRMALEVPHTALAVTIDLGDGKVHPGNMAPFGIRLALPARALLYGESKLAYSGPLYESMTREGSKIRLRFRQVGGGLVAKDGGPLKGFAIAGEDGKWIWADAKIDKETIIVSSPEIRNPSQVRYAWAGNPVFNLFNADGLPASPFQTTDKSPGKETRPAQ